MATFKLVISDPKTGKSYQKELQETETEALIGLKMGDKITGETINLTGYEFEITGGSDNCGFPMRNDISGSGRKKIFAVSGVGMRKQRRGQNQRKTVCGNTIHERISQINLKIIKYGKESLEPKSESVEEPKEGQPAPKEELKKEDKKPEKEAKFEAPAEKEELKKEEPKEDKAKDVVEVKKDDKKEEKPAEIDKKESVEDNKK